MESQDGIVRNKYCPHCASEDIHLMFDSSFYFECEHCNETWEHHMKDRELDPPFEEEELDPERKKAQDDLRDALLDIADMDNRNYWLEEQEK